MGPVFLREPWLTAQHGRRECCPPPHWPALCLAQELLLDWECWGLPLGPASTHQLALRLLPSSFLTWEVFFPLLEKALAKHMMGSKQELTALIRGGKSSLTACVVALGLEVMAADS